MRYTFEWDRIKAKENQRKHRISFDRAAEVLLDPSAVSIFDEEYSEDEGRWVTVGKDRRGSARVLIHTFSEVSTEGCTIRVISARKTSKRETKQYEEGV